MDQHLLIDRLATEGYDKLTHFVPGPPEGLLKRLLNGPDKRTALTEALSVLDMYARRMSGKRMVERPAWNGGGTVYLKRSKGQEGQQYPQVQSFIDRTNAALNTTLPAPVLA